MGAGVDGGIGGLVEELRRHMRVHGLRLEFDDVGRRLFDEVRDRIVEAAVEAGEVERAEAWAGVLVEELERAAGLLGAVGWSYSRELRSFLEDPRGHLRKKLFNYAFDLARGKIGVGDFVRRGVAAVRTSLRTNMRSIYQDWVLAAILSMLGERGGRLIYPETGVILLERSGRQRAGGIPPNAVVRLRGRGEVSLFLEAPRPVGWEDERDLARNWRLYTVLRPDILVYPGRVLDIAAPDRNPPIIRPHTIIECKELPDWYERVRDLRGPVARPMDALEWRSRWLAGLEEGLADALGIERSRARDLVEGRVKSVRVKEHRLLLLYQQTFKPEAFYLVSRARVPWEVRRDLEENGVIVVDGVEIGDRRALEEVAEHVARIARPAGPASTVEEAVGHALRAAEEALESGGDPLRALALTLLEDLSHIDPRAAEVLHRLKGQAGARA